MDERKQLLRQEENALEVDAVELVELCLGRLLKGCVMGDPGIVDEEVKAVGAELRERLLYIVAKGLE